MAPQTFTLDQRIYLFECYIRKRNCGKVRRRFATKFPGVSVPSRIAILNLVKKFRETGSVQNKSGKRNPNVLTSEKLHEIEERLKHSPRTSLRILSQETGVSKTTALRATKILNSKPYRVHELKPADNAAINSEDIGGISKSQSEDSSHSEITSSEPLLFLELTGHGATSSQNMTSQSGTSSSTNLLPQQNNRGVKRSLTDGKCSPEFGSNPSEFDHALLETNQIDAALSRLEGISDQVDQLNGRDDTFDNFGKYVASLLSGLPIRRATELQQEVINLILTSHINSDRSPIDLDLTSTTSSSTNFAPVPSTVTSEAKRTMQPPPPPLPPTQRLKTYQVPLSTKQKTSVPMSMHQQNKSEDRRPPKRYAQSHDTLSTTQMTGVHQALSLLQENNRQDKIPLADSDITSELGNSQSKFDDTLLETNKIDATLKRLEDISDKVSQLNRRDDSFDNFAQYAASLLRSLNIHRAMELQKEIVNIILRSLLNALPQAL